MKNISMSIVYLSIAFFISILSSSCTPELNERQKLFLDYAKLEDRYHGTSFYHNFDLYNLNIKAPIYMDSAFNIADFKAKLQKNFKLIDDGSADFGDLEIQYPFQYAIVPNNNGSANAKISVFVPDEYYKFSVDKSDLGKPIMKDSVEVTLLDITNDGVTLLIENKGMRQSYDYTYESSDRKDFSEKQKYVEPTDLGYHQYLFNSESVESPNRSRTTTKDNLVSENFSRLNITLLDEKGKTLVSEGSINDFRHYLWYRNNDMPFPELTSKYYNIKNKYKELDEDALNKFHPIYIVTLKASGKVGNVDFFLRSDKGNVETIDLGDLIPQKTNNQTRLMTQNEVLHISNIKKSEVNKLLKIKVTTVSGRLNEPDNILIYASLPYGYNNERTRWNFSDMKLIGDEKDTVAVTDYQDGDKYFDFFTSNSQPSNLAAVEISPKLQKAKRIIGKISLDVPNYYDKTFNLNNLPKWIKIGTDGATLSFYNNEPSIRNLVELLVFDRQGGTKPMDIITQTYDNGSNLVTNKYAEEVNKIVIRFKNPEESLSEEIPFELDIPQRKKEKPD